MVIIKYGYIPCDVKYLLIAYLLYASSLHLIIPSSCLSPSLFPLAAGNH